MSHHQGSMVSLSWLASLKQRMISIGATKTVAITSPARHNRSCAGVHGVPAGRRSNAAARWHRFEERSIHMSRLLGLAAAVSVAVATLCFPSPPAWAEGAPAGSALPAAGPPSDVPAAEAPPPAAPPDIPASVAAPAGTEATAPPPEATTEPPPPEAPPGFRVTAVEVAAERDHPEACFTFGDRLDKAQGAGYAHFVQITPTPAPPDFSVVARDSTLCVEGLAHGAAYQITLRAGLPGAGGKQLETAELHDITVPNRAPSLAFRGAGYILPRIGPDGLPLRTINVEHAHLRVLRITDRNLVEKIYAGKISQTLSDWDIGETVEKAGTSVWQGQLSITGPRNTPVITPFPIEAVLGGLEPGVYLAIAEPDAAPPAADATTATVATLPAAQGDSDAKNGADAKAGTEAGAGAGAETKTKTNSTAKAAIALPSTSRANKASQWFVVSDLGLTSFVGDDGLMVFARSLTSAQPVAGVELHLLARNGKVLAGRVTGNDGIARFEADIARKSGDDTAQALFAYGASGDFSFLDLAAPGFDLTDRGAGGRATPGPLDAYLYTERTLYRPGEMVAVTALLRTADVVAVPGRTLILKLWRPDGFEAERRIVDDAGAGAGAATFTLPDTAIHGVWSLTAHLDADAPAIGRAEFTVHNFLRPRIDLTLTANRPTLGTAAAPAATPTPATATTTTAGAGPATTPPAPPAAPPTTITIDGHYLFGTAASGLPGELSLLLRPAEAPFPGHDGFRFGLAQETFVPVRTELPGFTTNRAGKAVVDVPATAPPDSSHPLEAVIRGTIFDIGGRPVTRELVLPVQHQPFAIGLKPRFENDAVPEGATAGVDVIAVGADGTPIDMPGLSYELYEEDYDYRWFEANGHWDYETVVRDHRVTGGSLAVAASAPSVIEEPVTTGRYRLEVFDPKSGVASSVRFSAGWWVTPAAGDRPDKVEVSVMLPRYHGGDVARVYIRPPYDSQVLIAVADRTVRKTFTQRIDAKGAFLDIPVDAAWTAGVTIIATAYGAVDAAKTAPPPRAIGVGWLAVDPAPHTLAVKLDAAADSEPGQALTVGVTIRDATDAPLPASDAAYLTLAAVDESVLHLSDQTTPDPVAYYLGQRRLGVELRDVYGRLLEPVSADKTTARVGPPDKRRPRSGPGLPDRDGSVASLFSGIVHVGADGTAKIPFIAPAFDGRLRLIAVAWTGTRVGHSETTVTVRDRVAVELTSPRFLAPGDHAGIGLTLANQTGTAGDYQVTLTTDGALTLADAPPATVALKRGRQATLTRQLVADHPGAGTLKLEISGPDGFHLVRSRALTVRSPDPVIWRHRTSPLPAGEAVALPADLWDGLRPDSVTAALAIGVKPDLDRAGLAMITDQPLPDDIGALAASIGRLLASEDVTVALSLDQAATLHERIQRSLDRLAALQRADGGFGRWSSADDADPWLTAFVVDMLGRAHDAGYRLPETTTRSGLDWLKRLLNNGWFEERELPARAYALLVLARNKLIDAGTADYFQQTYGAKLQTELARAQLGAAQAALGNSRAATTAFNQAFDRTVERTADAANDFGDYGSALRDGAGVAALAAESGAVNRDRLSTLADRLANRIPPAAPRLSTQEQTWLALAGRALSTSLAATTPAKLTLQDKAVDLTGTRYQRLDPATPPAVKNTGTGPLVTTANVVGLPAEPPPAADQGFALTRTIFDMTGKPIKPEAIRLNDLLVVILEGHGTDTQRRQVVVTDPLPAGLDIENVRLADSAQLGDLSWLGELSPARHVDYSQDRFTAVLDLDEAHPGFRVVYLARAVVPGDFAQPGATVEAANAPSQFARIEAGRLHIRGEKE